MNKLPRVLITGGFGYIGGRVAQYLTKLGHHVILGSRNKRKKPNWLDDGEVCQINWDSEDSLIELCSKVDVVIHAAGINAQDCAKNPVLALDFNGVTTARLVKACQRSCISKFLYFSTTHVNSSQLIDKVNHNPNGLNLHPYATSHLAGEHAVLYSSGEGGDFSGTVLRLSNIIGAPVSPDANCWMLLVNDLCRQAVQNSKMVIKGNPKDLRDFVSMSTLCKVSANLINSLEFPKNKILDIKSGNQMSVYEMTNLAAKCFNDNFGFMPDIIFQKYLNKNILKPNSMKSKTVANDELILIKDEINKLLEFCDLNFR